MEKELSEMTLKELWELFPIILEEHNKKYSEWYSEMKTNILKCIGESNCIRINHIGSTAVDGLVAKPTIDILLEINKNSDIKSIVKRLEEDGWILMNSTEIPHINYVFNKGYTKDGFAEKVYHLHVRSFGDWDELYFRDYLIENNKISEKYAELKLKLLVDYKYNRDGYTEAKSEFIKKYSKEARTIYSDRYKYHGK